MVFVTQRTSRIDGDGEHEFVGGDSGTKSKSKKKLIGGRKVENVT